MGLFMGKTVCRNKLPDMTYDISFKLQALSSYTICKTGISNLIDRYIQYISTSPLIIDIETMAQQESDSVSFFGRTARATARNSWRCLISAIVVATVLSVIGLVVGGFTIEADNKGWRSRGTPIADREMQVDVVNLNRQALFEDKEGSVWEKLRTTATVGYVDLRDRDEFYTRKLAEMTETPTETKNSFSSRLDPLKNAVDDFRKLTSKRMHQASTQREKGSLEKFRNFALEDTCDVSWYGDYEAVLFENNVFAVWKVQPNLKPATLSALDKEVMSQICEAEVNTLKIMQDAKVCKTCSDGECVPPLSLVFLLRQKLNDHDSSCENLMNAYTGDVQEEFTSELVTCTTEYVENFDSSSLVPGPTTSCPPGFQASLVDYSFGKDGNDKLRYTSSYFYTNSEGDEEAEAKRSDDLYSVYLDFDGADGITVQGVYDTTNETFNLMYVDKLIVSDMVSAEYCRAIHIFFFSTPGQLLTPLDKK